MDSITYNITVDLSKQNSGENSWYDLGSGFPDQLISGMSHTIVLTIINGQDDQGADVPVNVSGATSTLIDIKLNDSVFLADILANSASRNMPWWLLGVSMVATTFSTDTPNLVTDLVRQDGVAGNWAWWAFLLTGMLTVFVYAKLWRRSGVLTDIEFYELRYSGKAAAFLRGFRALYLGLVFNVLVMGAVSLAAVKFGEIVLGLPGWHWADSKPSSSLISFNSPWP